MNTDIINQQTKKKKMNDFLYEHLFSFFTYICQNNSVTKELQSNFCLELNNK